MIRAGLCCIFFKENIKFRTTTATYLKKLDRKKVLNYLSEIILENTISINKALNFCKINKIGAFRVTSRFFPLFTHPDISYQIIDLKDNKSIFSNLENAKNFAKKNNIRITFHPDQFVVLNSFDKKIVKNAVLEIEYHNYLADMLGGDVINIHAGGVYGDKIKALKNLEKNLSLLSSSSLKKLTIENDDKSYMPKDLLPFCRSNKIPFVYDVHHHRCLKDDVSICKATDLAIDTWNREPLFHLSSPKYRNSIKKYSQHSDYIDIIDLPKCWLNVKNLTIDLEAKAKELAVIKFMKDLNDIKKNE